MIGRDNTVFIDSEWLPDSACTKYLNEDGRMQRVYRRSIGQRSEAINVDYGDLCKHDDHVNQLHEDVIYISDPTVQHDGRLPTASE